MDESNGDQIIEYPQIQDGGSQQKEHQSELAKINLYPSRMRSRSYE